MMVRPSRRSVSLKNGSLNETLNAGSEHNGLTRPASSTIPQQHNYSLPGDPFPLLSQALSGDYSHRAEQYTRHILNTSSALSSNNTNTRFQSNSIESRNALVKSLLSSISDEISYSLSILNVLSSNTKTDLIITDYHALLYALTCILDQYLIDLKNPPTLPPQTQLLSSQTTHLQPFPPFSFTTAQTQQQIQQECIHYNERSSALYFREYFDVKSVDEMMREDWVLSVSNILRNVSMISRNAKAMNECVDLFKTSADIIQHGSISKLVRQNLVDMFLNLSLSLSEDEQSIEILLQAAMNLLDPKSVHVHRRWQAESAQLIANLSASFQQNNDASERAIISKLDAILPLLVDLMHSANEPQVEAALHAVCNISAFENESVRRKLARAVSLIPRLIAMLGIGVKSVRAALTLLNLAEIPANRFILLQYEQTFIYYAFCENPASEIIARVLKELVLDLD